MSGSDIYFLLMPLIVKPISAQLNKDGDFFGKAVQDFLIQDPYCVVLVGQEKQRSEKHSGGGKQPHWNSTLQFQSTDSILRVQVWDDDLGKDDLMGEGTVNLNQCYQNPNRTENCSLFLIQNMWTLSKQAGAPEESFCLLSTRDLPWVEAKEDGMEEETKAVGEATKAVGEAIKVDGEETKVDGEETKEATKEVGEETKAAGEETKVEIKDGEETRVLTKVDGAEIKADGEATKALTKVGEETRALTRAVGEIKAATKDGVETRVPTRDGVTRVPTRADGEATRADGDS